MNRNRIIIVVLCAVVIAQAAIIFFISRKKRARHFPVKARIAIVLDDWGYNLNNIPVLERIKSPLTLAVLPNLQYSREVSEEAHRRGFEVILHLPAQPHENYPLEQNTVLVSMDERAIRSIVSKDLESIAFAKGASNHMGSKATEDYAAMGAVFKELKKRRLYFLDSFVTPKTICPELARKIKLRFAKRDIFLDNSEEPAYIKGQVNKLKRKALMYGSAIGIGHDRRATLEVLQEVIPELEREGYKLVYLSELVR